MSTSFYVMGGRCNIGRYDRKLESVSFTSMMQHWCCPFGVFLEPVDLTEVSEMHNVHSIAEESRCLLQPNTGEWI
jgi:hypothetical protein